MPSMRSEQHIQCFEEDIKQESCAESERDAPLNNPSRPEKCASS